jgi:serine protease AprX
MNTLFKRVAIAALVLIPRISAARHANIAPDLDNADPRSVANVIVQFQDSPTVQDASSLSQLGAVRQARDLGAVNGILCSLPAKAIAALSANPRVRYVTPDRVVTATLDYATASLGADRALLYGWAGSGIGVAVIDSGIATEADLSKRGSGTRIVYSQSFVPGASAVTDQYGHGTHVAGIVAGNGAASTGMAYFKTFRGIAPDANLISLRVLDSTGKGTDSAVISAINTAIQLKNKYNIRVINLSLGRPVFESYAVDPLCQAVERAWQAGIVVVVAAGNDGRDQSQGTDGYATITAPGNDPRVITVGAMKTEGTLTRSDDMIASYSSKGPTLLDHVVKPDVVAPGNRIVSLEASKSSLLASSISNLIPYSYYKNPPAFGMSPDYLRLSGTSMAAPMVSGAAVLMLSKDASLTPDTVKARLMKTASKNFPATSTAIDPVTGISYTSQYDIFTIGAGYVDIWAALNCKDVLPTGASAASPVANYNPVSGGITVVNGITSVWGAHAVWGSAEIWSATAVWGNTVFLDGQAALWGTSAVWGSAAVWGTVGAQGNSTIWGTHAVWGTSTTNAGEALVVLTAGEN